MCIRDSVVCVVVLAACARSSNPVKSGSSKAVTATSELGIPDNISNVGVYTGNSEYRIGPQDLLEINIFLNEDLKREVRVNTGGQISLPLIGSIQAGGKTVQELEQMIATQYNQTYLQNPQINVFIKEFTSQRVTIEGVVKKPGIYPITGKTSLIQAIAIGGGVDEMANEETVVVFRVVGGKRMAAVFNLEQIRTGEAADPEIYGDDIVVVDKSHAKSIFKHFIETIPVLNVFRYY
jgi:polysaccharide export outer membrane protein